MITSYAYIVIILSRVITSYADIVIIL